jgi:hypothetical protein
MFDDKTMQRLRMGEKKSDVLRQALRVREFAIDGKRSHCGGRVSRHKASGVQDCDSLTAKVSTPAYYTICTV